MATPFDHLLSAARNQAEIMTKRVRALLLDGSQDRFVIHVIGARHIIITKSWAPTHQPEHDLLVHISDMLRKIALSIHDISHILVRPRPGSFTRVRITVTVANTLAWALDVPVITTVDEDHSATVAMLKHLGTHFQGAVAPVYDREPSVTLRKA